MQQYHCHSVNQVVERMLTVHTEFYRIRVHVIQVPLEIHMNIVDLRKRIHVLSHPVVLGPNVAKDQMALNVIAPLATQEIDLYNVMILMNAPLEVPVVMEQFA